MNFPVLSYLKQECGPHWRELVFDRQIFYGGSAVALAVYWPGTPVGFTVGKLAEVSQSYGAVALGFALTIYTIALALPQPEVVSLLAGHRPAGEKTDAYAKLLFIFSWTAVAQCVLVISAFAIQLSVDTASPLRRVGFLFSRDALICVTVFLLVYAVLQFLNSILAVAQLGRIIAGHARLGALKQKQRSQFSLAKKEVFASSAEPALPGKPDTLTAAR